MTGKTPKATSFNIYVDKDATVEEVKTLYREVQEWSHDYGDVKVRNKENTLLTAVGASQVISNVPAAVLLSGFTTDWKGLLLGVNVGGLGTLIASLASLISFRFYAAEKDSSAGKYLLVFTLVNVIGLALLVPMALLCL